MRNLFFLCALIWLISVNALRAYYDAETGTFITRDPLGFVDGPNVYNYVTQNPWTKFDPLGLYAHERFMITNMGGPASSSSGENAGMILTQGILEMNSGMTFSELSQFAAEEGLETMMGGGFGAGAIARHNRNLNIETGDPPSGQLPTSKKAPEGSAKFENAISGKHGGLKNNLESGAQSHHLNQNAAFKSKIPKDEGAAVGLKGNAFTDIGSQHFNAHSSLEKFWGQFRRGGARAGEKPTVLEYNKALRQSLLDAGATKKEAGRLVKEARANQKEFGLELADEVPRIPRKLPQKKTN